jgi:hypothetical protein
MVSGEVAMAVCIGPGNKTDRSEGRFEYGIERKGRPPCLPALMP